MKRRKQTDSTQKLLEHIRNSGNSDKEREENSSGSTISTPSSSNANPGSKVLNSSSRAADKIKSILPSTPNTAIELSDEYIRLFSCEEKTGAIYNYKEVPLETELESEDFPVLLKRILTDFWGKPSKRSNIWGIVPINDLDLHIINIPKVKDREIPDTLFWSLKKEKSIEERDLLMDYKVQGEIVEKGVSKLSILALTTSYSEVQFQKELFEKAGFPLTGITTRTSALQNFLNKHMQGTLPKTVSMLYIGKDGTSISIFEEGSLSMLRNIRTGTDSMLEELQSHLPSEEEEQESFEFSEDKHLVEEISSAPKDAKQILYSIFSEPSENSFEESGDYPDREQIFEIIHPTVQRLTRQVERSFSYYSQTLLKDPVDRIYLCGDAAASPQIKEHIQEQLGIETYQLNVFSKEATPGTDSGIIPTGSPQLSGNIPDTTLEQIQHSLLYGLALSDNNHTLNLLYTYNDKRIQKNIYRINEVVIAASAALAIFLGATYFWQSGNIAPLRQEYTQLENELNDLTPYVEKDQLIQLASRVNQKQSTLKSYSHRFVELAAFSEIMHVTPSEIKLHQVDIETKPKFKNNDQSFGKGSIVLKGVIWGEKNNFESVLASYMLDLRNSAILSKPDIQKRERKIYRNKGEVLYFVIYVNLV